MQPDLLHAHLNDVVRQVLLIVGALFPIVNPVGGAPMFLTLTSGASPAIRNMLARKVALNGFFLLLASIFIGTHILAFFGISLPVVQVGGGLVLLSSGWKLLHHSNEETVERRRMTPSEAVKEAFYPLTLPLTVGPGSISVAITMGANRPQGSAMTLSALISGAAGAAIVALSIYLCYRFAAQIARALGATAMNVFLRLSSFILVCIGVQIIWNGVTALLRTLPRT
jgi:multiple antibiotic resistance protein